MDATQDELDNGHVANINVFGKCGCAFHKDCFKAWEKTGNKLCPVDSSTWTVKDTAPNTVVWNTLT
jgi:hypothetical protein